MKIKNAKVQMTKVPPAELKKLQMAEPKKFLQYFKDQFAADPGLLKKWTGSNLSGAVMARVETVAVGFLSASQGIKDAVGLQPGDLKKLGAFQNVVRLDPGEKDFVGIGQSALQGAATLSGDLISAAGMRKKKTGIKGDE